jgi:hypothetical protein
MRTCHPATPRVEKVNICFEILDELSEKAGAFKNVMKQVVEELRNSVFSQVVTSSLSDPFVEKIPYFSLIQRFEKQRINASTKNNDYVAEILQKLKFRDHDLTILYKKNLALKQTMNEHEETEKNLRERVHFLESEVKKYIQHEAEADVSSQ